MDSSGRALAPLRETGQFVYRRLGPPRFGLANLILSALKRSIDTEANSGTWQEKNEGNDIETKQTLIPPWAHMGPDGSFLISVTCWG